ncbi:mitochondrial inner membrane protease subunit [Raphidocelis subcapitata]|uniref:Mitochondrial inner membrane protease subunit n=1 Tax=Raphidocelis subcapitata TaxID=307507 RepID=A0A2V0PI68_9CHLO|nr:mitochondrial inner membrane protease subunit [Raphidocelis subcapitata]|eukprot:GBF99501.1 mitochondrial inner membrane protease subunit [Raphidocelis subcapitata]
MSAAKPLPSRYVLLKAMTALEAAMSDLSARTAAGARLSLGESAGVALSKFREAYSKPLTSVMYIAGAAMAPSLNKQAQEDAAAVEKLVVRLIPRPSPRTIGIGDVVAFSSPLDAQGQHVMVRRVAALEAHEMVSDDPEEPPFRVPPGHCWVLADNPAMEPPDVPSDPRLPQTLRTPQHLIPLSSILGRIIYRVAASDAHGPVTNSPAAAASDAPVVEAEVDVESLTAGMDGGS